MVPIFSDRTEAGRRLADRLHVAHLHRPLVLGLPRGGVVVAAQVARRFGVALDVVLVRKLGVPGQPELAMGAIGEGGITVLDRRVMRHVGASPEGIRRVEDTERVELERRRLRYRGERPACDVTDRDVVIVDDGVATGSTMRAACLVVRGAGSGRIVVAVPVAPAGWEAKLADVADEFVAVVTPARFEAIGVFYDDFRQSDDATVVRCLDEASS